MPRSATTSTPAWSVERVSPGWRASDEAAWLQHPRVGRQRVGLPFLRQRHHARPRGEVEERRQHRGTADPVEDRVMHLGHQRRPFPLEPLDDVHLPQRAVGVERAAHHRRHERVQLGLAARRREARPAQVVVELEVGVVRPRPGGAARTAPGSPVGASAPPGGGAARSPGGSVRTGSTARTASAGPPAGRAPAPRPRAWASSASRATGTPRPCRRGSASSPFLTPSGRATRLIPAWAPAQRPAGPLRSPCARSRPRPARTPPAHRPRPARRPPGRPAGSRAGRSGPPGAPRSRRSGSWFTSTTWSSPR